MSLYEYGGHLVAANRGLIEYSDLLKRPMEAYKYLITTVERATVSLMNATVFLDVAYIGTTNEIHLAAFKETAEFQSFQGRVALTRVPYLLDYRQEAEIYRSKLAEAATTRHIAPHCAEVAAQWAVLARMRQPAADRYPGEISEVVGKLTPLEKADLYADGRVPKSLNQKQARDLKSQLGALWRESGAYPNYEGRTGASPREMQVVIFNAANSTRYDYVSPIAILDEIAELCQQQSVYLFLQQESLPGGYHDHQLFINLVRGRLIERVDDEIRSSLGLVDDVEYERFFNRYVDHVMHWTRKEKVRNETTGAFEEPDEKMMTEVEATLGVAGDSEEFRHGLIGRIGAWSLDNPNAKPEYHQIFTEHFQQLREAYYAERMKIVARGVQDLMRYLTDESAPGLSDTGNLAAAEKRLLDRGYTRASARDLITLVYRERYADKA